MSVCNVRGVAHMDEPKENNHLTLQIPTALWRVSAHCLAVCPATLALVHSHHSHSAVLSGKKPQERKK